MPTNNADIGITYIDANTPPLTPSDDEIYFCKQSESIWVGDTQHSIGPLEHDITTYSFDDGIDSYFKKVVSSIVPVQAGSGTPSPTNVRAISGFTECTVLDRGINQWDEQWELGNISTTDGTNTSADNRIRSTNYTRVGHQTYYIKKSIGMVVYFYDVNLNFMSYTTLGNNTSEILNIPDGCDFIRFTLSTSYGTTYNNNISINYPATDTDYHAYNGTSATISFGSAGTVYGGYVDLTSGKLVVDRAMVDLGTLSWFRYPQSSTNIPVFYAEITGMLNANKGASLPICSSYRCEQWTSLTTRVDGTLQTHPSLAVVYVADTRFDIASDFETAVNGVQLVYDLATPVEFQLTPAQLRSLVGANRLTSSTGEVTEVEYIRNETISWVIDQIQDNSVEWTVIP